MYNIYMCENRLGVVDGVMMSKADNTPALLLPLLLLRAWQGFSDAAILLHRSERAP